jgi:hypothetical protein
VAVQPGEYVGQPGLRIDIVELGRLDQPSFSALLARSRSRLIASASRIGAAASKIFAMGDATGYTAMPEGCRIRSLCLAQIIP